MPIKKAAFKDLRQSKTRALRNKKVKSDIQALIKKVNKAVTAKDFDKARDWLKQLIKKVDKAAQKGVLKKNTAARKKSRMSKAVSKASKVGKKG